MTLGLEAVLIAKLRIARKTGINGNGKPQENMVFGWDSTVERGMRIYEISSVVLKKLLFSQQKQVGDH